MRRAFTLIEFSVIVLILAVLALIFFPVTVHVTPERRSACQANLKQVGLGFVQYTQDHGEKYPPVKSGGAIFGWADALDPYLGDPQIYQCPSEPDTRPRTASPRSTGYTDYWFNARLAGQPMRALPSPATAVLTGEGNDGRDAANSRYALGAIPAAWTGDSKSPLYRHLEGSNFGFADGHVKWIAARSVIAPAQVGPFRLTP